MVITGLTKAADERPTTAISGQRCVCGQPYPHDGSATFIADFCMDVRVLSPQPRDPADPWSDYDGEARGL